MRPSRRANLQHHGTICRLVNFLDPAFGQGRSKFTRHLRNFCRSQCHDSTPILLGIFTHGTNVVARICAV